MRFQKRVYNLIFGPLILKKHYSYSIKYQHRYTVLLPFSVSKKLQISLVWRKSYSVSSSASKKEVQQHHEDIYHHRQDFDAAYDEYKNIFKLVQTQVNTKENLCRIEEIKTILESESSSLNSLSIWEESPHHANHLSKELGRLESAVIRLDKIQQEVTNIVDLYDMASDELNSMLTSDRIAGRDKGDKTLHLVVDDCRNKLCEVVEDLKKEKFKLLFKNYEEDSKPCYLEIVAGSGGTDSQNWAFMLFQMYSKWLKESQNKAFDSGGLEVVHVDVNKGEMADTIRSAIFKVEGEYSYGFLKSESGVHRLVRISPYDSQARRHTSFAMVRVFPYMENDSETMSGSKGNEIPSSDLKIETMKAQGPGGQHVNKTNSAVRITHLPTSITATSQSQRSQHHNMREALSILKSKLFQLHQIANENKKRELLAGLEPNENTWGKQIRSYVLHPYIMCKDHRTNFEVKNNAVEDVLNGGNSLTSFMEAFLEAKID